MFISLSITTIDQGIFLFLGTFLSIFLIDFTIKSWHEFRFYIVFYLLKAILFITHINMSKALNLDLTDPLRDTIIRGAIRAMKKGNLELEKSIKDVIIYSASYGISYAKFLELTQKYLTTQKYFDKIVAKIGSHSVMNAGYVIVLDGMFGGEGDGEKKGKKKGALNWGHIIKSQGKVAVVGTIVQEFFSI